MLAVSTFILFCPFSKDAEASVNMTIKFFKSINFYINSQGKKMSSTSLRLHFCLVV